MFQESLTKILLLAREKLSPMLPQNFLPIVDCDALHVLMLGRRESKAVQRQLTVYPSGETKLQVHGEDFPISDITAILWTERLT